MTDPDQIVRKLQRTMRLYKVSAYSCGLRPAQWEALRFFAKAPEKQRTVSGLAQARASTMGTASATVTALVNQGLLERAAAGRNVGLRVTEQGACYLAKWDPAERLERAIARLAPVRSNTLDEALSAIIESLEGCQPEQG